MDTHVHVEQIAITRGVLESVSEEDIPTALDQHFREPLSDVRPFGRDEREWCLSQDRGVLSSHFDREGTEFWILTHTFPRATTILLPEEY